MSSRLVYNYKSMLAANIQNQYVKDCILHKLRYDGRQLFDYRKVQVSFFKERGCLQLKLGGTAVIARTKADIVIPKPDRPSEGPINFKVDTSIKEQSRKLSTQIGKLFEKIIKESNALDPSSLCITTGKYVWALTCETTLVSDEGNVVDAMAFALILSLLDFRKPGIKIQKGELQMKTNLQALSIHHTPICFTFGLMEGGVFLDPHHQEQQAYQGRITITMNIYKDICSIHKPGGMPIEQSTLMKLIEVCELKVKEFTTLIRNFVEQRHQFLIR